MTGAHFQEVRPKRARRTNIGPMSRIALEEEHCARRSNSLSAAMFVRGFRASKPDHRPEGSRASSADRETISRRGEPRDIGMSTTSILQIQRTRWRWLTVAYRNWLKPSRTLVSYGTKHFICADQSAAFSVRSVRAPAPYEFPNHACKARA